MERKEKIRLLALLLEGEITKDEFNAVIENGLPPKPIIYFDYMERTEETDRKYEILNRVYKKIGVPFHVIEFVSVAGMSKEEIDKIHNDR